MSKIGKAVKKVWRPIEKLGSKITNVATLGLHKKWKKVRHKIIKSKAFKVVVAAAAIYFGGAALLSMAGGGTASAGLGSAWAGAQGAGSAIAAGNFSGAASALGTGFSGGAAAGAGATFGAGQAATANAIAANAAAGQAAAVAGIEGAVTSSSVPSVSSASELAAQGASQFGTGASAVNTNALTSLQTGMNATNAAANSAIGSAASNTAANAASEGLLSGAWNSLGQYGKGAVITGGMQMAGSAIQGKAQQDAADEERKRRTYWGMDGEGNTAGQNNFMDFGLLGQNNDFQNTPPSTTWQTTLDDLINRQKQTVGGNG